ncbi:MAG: hypothetical protein PHD71_05810 [Methanospirillum sp.]|nr:hypothetical protein [Methanospirillum sp.]
MKNEMMQNKLACVLFVAMFFCIGILTPALKAAHIDEDKNYLNILAKTDRGYYSPGDVIRVKGKVTDEDMFPVQARLVFQFQGMNTTADTKSDGLFIIRVPISFIEPENMYRLTVSAHAEGFEERNFSIPIIIMGEPSSLAPVPVIPDEFSLI